MEKIRNILMMSALVSISGLAAAPASAQSRADRERCAESVGIQTHRNGRNVWIRNRVPSKTYYAFLRCTDALVMKRADATPGRR
ncbi:hypothetical protein PUR29_15655 [Methylobacterium ajmalii]